MNEGCDYVTEFRVQWPDGTVRWVEARGRFECDSSGRATRSYGAMLDITERKQTAEALLESERRLERAQEIAHLGSWELDLVNNRLSWSDEVYRIFGLQPQEFGATYEAFLLESILMTVRLLMPRIPVHCVREGMLTRSSTG